MPPIRREDGSTLIVLGPGTIDNVGSELAELGATRVYLVTGPSLASGRVGARVRRAFGGLLVGTYARSRPHVPSETMDEVVREARSLRADVLVGLGGGSPIGTADLERHRKSVLRSDPVRPRLALYDPELALDTPPDLSASTGVNALAHCVEALYAKDAGDDERTMALRAAGRIVEFLPRTVRDPRNLLNRYRMFEGSMEAGLVLAKAGMGVHHGLCHVLGGRYNAPHGVLNGIVLPHAMRFNIPIATTAYRDLAPILGVKGEGLGDAALGEEVCKATATFVRGLGLPRRLRDLGIPRGDLPSVAEEAMESKSVRANPRPVTRADALRILEAAW